MARPLAPQPVLSDAQPVPLGPAPSLQPVRNNYALKSTRTRRGTINAACHECRLKKLKCDGLRPQCRRCSEKGIEACVYAVNPGETRFTALKRKNAVLTSDSDRMRNFIHALRSATPTRTQSLLHSLRVSESTPEVTDLLNLLQDRPPLYHEDSDPTSSSVSSHPSLSTETTRIVSVSPVSTLDSTDQPSLCSPISSAERDICSNEPESSPFTDLQVQIPSREILERCIATFYTESGQMFHVLSREQVESQFETMFGQADHRSRRLAACELCALAAIGSQYTEDLVSTQIAQALYSVAKHLLEDLIDDDGLRASKTCALLGMYNVMNKEKVAMTFIDMGINLVQRSEEFTSRICPSGMDRTRWVSARKSWRILTFLERWLSSTLGYISKIPFVPTVTDTTTVEIEGESSLEDKVMTEMIKIVTIKFDLLRLSLSFKEFSPLTVQTITTELQQWYQNLPDELRLSELNKNLDVSHDLRRTVYYINFLYFGAQIMLLRRVLHGSSEQGSMLDGANMVTMGLMDQVNYAARTSAQLFRRFKSEGNVVKRCWICIFHAYSSCIFMLYQAAQNLLFQRGNPGEGLYLAFACLDFLQLCRSADVAAGQFSDTLRPFHETLQAVLTGLNTDRASLESTAAALRDLVTARIMPRGQIDAGTKTDSPHTSPGLSSSGWKTVDGITNDGTINDLVNAKFSGQFLPGFESHAWRGNAQLD